MNAQKLYNLIQRVSDVTVMVQIDGNGNQIEASVSKSSIIKYLSDLGRKSDREKINGILIELTKPTVDDDGVVSQSLRLHGLPLDGKNQK